MLLELALADSYGSPFEYAPDAFVAAFNTGDKYPVKNWSNFVPRAQGIYTDDTQMSLAIAEALISREPWTPLMLANRFVLAFKRDVRKGYARAFYDFLESISSGEEFLQKISAKSDKSGGAMRAAPIGVLPNIGEIMQKCRIQAALTHNTTDGMNAAMAASLLTHYCFYNLGAKKEVGQFIQEFVAGPWSAPYIGKVEAKGWMSVRAAITAVVEGNSMTDVLKRSIAFTGDVDTVASIALAAASHCDEIKKDLAPALIEGLENGPYGRDYIIDLDRQLLELAK